MRVWASVVVVVVLLCLSTFAAADPIWKSAPKGKRCLCRYVAMEGFVYDRLEAMTRSGLFSSKCACSHVPHAVLCHTYKQKKNGAWEFLSSENVRAKNGLLNPCTAYVPARSLDEYEKGFASPKYANSEDYKKINYFWWGALSSTSKPEYLNSALLAVNKIAVMMKDQGFQIRYYHQPTATALNRGLNDDIEQVTIGNGGTIATPGDLLADTDLADLGDTINDIIATYEFYGAKTFAGVKDLLILCILYANGGYFFDTNVRPDDGVDGDDLAQALTTFGRRRGIPAYPHLYPMDEVLTQPTEACMYFKEDSSGTIEPETPIAYFPKMEFNGAFVPKGHPATRTAILQYVLQAKAKGLTTGGKASKDSTHKSWTAGDQSFKRDVGVLIRSAVCSGLLKYGQETPVTMSEFLFEITKHKGGLAFVPLKLSKFYGNTWRNADLEAYLTSLEENISALGEF